MMQNVTDIYPLSPLQQDMLFDTVYASKRSAYVAYVTFRVHGDLHVALFKQAWQKIMERHPVLRTAFVWERVKKPVQVVRKEVVLPWDDRDWRGLDEEQQERQLQQYLDEEPWRGFNPGQAPLTRVALVRLRDNQYQFIWTYSNLCLDGRSIQIICQDLFAHYRSLSEGREPDFPKPRPFRDFIALLQHQDRAGAQVFWQEALRGIVPPAPFVIEGSEKNASTDPHYRNVSDKLDRTITEKLQAAARQYGLDVNTFIQGAWAWLLSCYSGSVDVVFGVTSMALPMTREGAGSITGVLLNTLPVRTGVGRDEQVLNRLKKLQTYQSEAQKYGCSSLAEIKKWSGFSKSKPLFETVLVFESQPLAKEVHVNGDLTFVSGPIHSDMQYPVTLYVELKEELSLCLMFDASRLIPETAAGLMRHFKNILSEMALNVERKWESISVVPVDREYPLHSGNGSTLEPVQGQKGQRELAAQAAVKTEQKSRVDRPSGFAEIPENGIPPNCAVILPGMLSLVELSEEEIEKIVSGVPGGARNVQDIYPLTPLQEGILFHHLMGEEGDPYLLARLMSFKSRVHLDACANALQAIVDRHDIMRTAVVWEGLREPVQVAWRKAKLPVEEVVLDGTGDAAEQLSARYSPRHHRIDVRQAPLMRIYIAKDEQKGRWLMLMLLHHLLGDHNTWDAMGEEVEAHLLGLAAQLPKPEPFRNLVAQARLGVSQEEHKAFFRQMLGDVEEPTLPFGLADVQGDGQGIEEAFLVLGKDLEWRVREGARKLGVSAASVCHAAWAQVLAKVSGREDVVFGTVRLGRMGGAERGMGLFMNTLPIRVRVGAEEVEASVRSTHSQLSELLRHEHASLTLAQKCSGVPASMPLFSSLLNHRNTQGAAGKTSTEARRAWDGMQQLGGEERTNYPVTMSLSFGDGIKLWAQTARPVDPERVCRYMSRALELLAEALQNETRRAMWTLDVLPEEERRQLLYEWNETKAEFPSGKCVQELFEEQVRRSPEATAVVFEEEELSYGELNARANRLAHYLRELGVKPDERVAICVERGFEMIVGLLAILKAGGAYVPLDPKYPTERLQYMLEDAQAAVLLMQERVREKAGSFYVGRVVCLEREWADIAQESGENLSSCVDRENLAYLIYTSGSTGRPKSVGIRHGSVAVLLHWAREMFCEEETAGVLASTSMCFDLSVFEMFVPLSRGGRVLVVDNALNLADMADREKVTLVNTVPSAMAELVRMKAVPASVRVVNLAGEALSRTLVNQLYEQETIERVFNLYGPSEDTTYSTYELLRRDEPEAAVSIGRPLANSQVYVLDESYGVVPVGVAGELYIGGDGLARGYLNRPELTAEKFVPNPFSTVGGERLYRTGDRVKWRAEGKLDFLGRIDQQVKMRGFRIELGEIEARLQEHEGVREAIVVAREDTAGDKKLVAYVVPEQNEENDNGSGRAGLRIGELREHLLGKLPEYMVPNVYVQLEKLPLNHNGKIDRKALPQPDSDTPEEEYVGPRNTTEETLGRLWQEVLRRERVGIHDDFLKVGGHSLLAAQVATRMRESFKVDIPLRRMFESPTIAQLAEVIDQAVQTAGVDGTPSPLRPAIKRIARKNSLVEVD
jgi:amino acid adenylation domain-containing protein